jgi:hypothetical protein
MKIFIWNRLSKVSDCYHSEGGLVVVAEDLERAKALAHEDPNIVVDEEPSAVYDLAARKKVTPRVFVFLDAGCC